MEFVKATLNGETFNGTFNHWFTCDLTGDKIGVIDCYDGEQRAFNLETIKKDDNQFQMHEIGCNCYNCL